MKELLKIAPKYECGNCIAICMLGVLRKGECLGLSIEDVDIDNCSIFIHQQLQEGKVVHTTKNCISAKIKIPYAAKPFLLVVSEIGVEGLRIHNLRHSMATLISNLSEDLNEVQHYLRQKQQTLYSLNR